MTRPQLKLDEAIAYCNKHLVTDPVKLLAIRGYYKRTMGNPTANDRNIYDDAFFILTPFIYRSFNANVDPSVNRPGVAVLQPGVYYHRKGLHNISKLNRARKDHEAIYRKLITSGKDAPEWPRTYWALRQDSDVTVLRDGATEPVTDSPDNRFWINVHKGNYSSTSSLGCLTIYPDQWVEFRDTVFAEMARCRQDRVPTLLIEE